MPPLTLARHEGHFGAPYGLRIASRIADNSLKAAVG
jgi:hypothetical protein